MMFNDGNYNNSVLRIAYYGRAVWESPLYNPSVNIQEVDAKNTYHLSLFPNPTQGETFIKYSLKENSHVFISICDALGKDVLYVMNEKQNVGEHQFTINSDQLSNGIYFVKMIVNGEKQMQKLIVAK